MEENNALILRFLRCVCIKWFIILKVFEIGIKQRLMPKLQCLEMMSIDFEISMINTSGDYVKTILP